MDKKTFLNEAPFSVFQTEKKSLYLDFMNTLTEHHRKSCKAYDDICNGVSGLPAFVKEVSAPYLPVALFKDLELFSVTPENIIKKVTSSGTTGQNVSKIYLDAETSYSQQRALCMITSDFIGGDRMPMLIIDSPDVLRDRTKFSARGAGVLGFSMMASKRYYALTADMKLNWDSINEFCEKSAEGPTFAFGFTYIIWAYFYKALREAGYGNKSGKSLGLEECYLIHGGGWKKLQNEKVSDAQFKQGLNSVCGIEKVANYYGMAEQTGSIFMECPCGHLHASIYSDIKSLNPIDFSECAIGEWGLMALESLLPESYPGHMILTEDWGRVLGEDDCPCGRKGRYFEIKGRIKKAEIRGCSDTFEEISTKYTNQKIENTDDTIHEELEILAGEYPPYDEPFEAFAPVTLDFIEKLSKLFTKDRLYRRYPEICALGFWCKKSHIDQIKNKNKKAKGKGLVLHITPANMPTMFTYSFITSTLAGNSNVVRLSNRETEISNIIIDGIKSILDKPEFEELKKRNAFVRFPHDNELLKTISAESSARIIWGGDDTVRAINSIPKADGCVDIAFPDKYSIGLINGNDIIEAEPDELKLMAHMFYNDTYGADQNACSSPKTVFWIDANQGIKEKWWNAVADQALDYELQPWMATEKYRILCTSYARNGYLGIKGLQPVKTWSNRLYVIPCNTLPKKISDLQSIMGIFYEYDLDTLEDLFPYLNEKIQTIVSSGNNQDEILQAIRNSHCAGVDRVVHLGEALNFDTTWDRKNLIEMLSK